MRLTEKQAAGIGRVVLKRPKYRNKKVVVNGQTFDSGREYKRYQELQLLEAAGEISELRTQVVYELIPKQQKFTGGCERAVKYIADFAYRKGADLFVEDSKGVRTPDYILKRKLMLSVHGIEVIEV